MDRGGIDAFVVEMGKLRAAMGQVADAWRTFGVARNHADEVQHLRRVRTDPTYVPYRFESAEARAERRRKLHARSTS